ncbi:MAG: YqcC family protein [Pseudomonadota bacterium]
MHTDAASLLIDLESELRQLGLWSAKSPSASALASSQPFAIDTLKFEEWLQFVFLPRMYGLIEARQPLPVKCAIAPMAEEYFCGGQLPIGKLLNTLRSLDELLSSEA